MLTLQVLGVLLVDKGGQVTAIIKNHVKRLSARESGQSLFNAPCVLFFSLAFPSVNRDTSSGDSGSGVVLSGKDVLFKTWIDQFRSVRCYFSSKSSLETHARRPCNLSTERGESLDEHGGLYSPTRRTSQTQNCFQIR